MATLPMGEAESIKHVHPSLNARPMRSRSFEPRPLRQLWTRYSIPLRMQYHIIKYTGYDLSL